ncbi:MAG TPA: PKD domain-containing protein, partial [bacterium]|nr:PKD domain-containing protein [bacterium]
MRFAYLIPVGLLAAMLGCQGGSEVTGPAAPASTGTPPAPASLQEYVPAAAYAGGGSVAPALEGTLGVWTLHYTNGTAEVTPVRSAAATPGVGTFDVDVTDAFMRSFCGGCVAVESVSINGNGRPVVTVAATHPFELGDPALPPSAQNRRDLFIFNVRGVLAAEADPETIAGVTVSEDLLEDPDGYYPHQGLFPTGTLTADAFPYMVFGVDPPGTGTGNFDNATGQWTDMANPTGFNVLGQGETGTAQFTLDIDPGETREFSLVLVARYGQSVTGRATRLTPEYYSAEFASDPWRVEANEPATPFDQTPTNFQAVTVEVYDFAMAYGAEDPGYPSANHLGLSWDPGLDLELHVPGFRATPFTPSAPPTGTGSLDDPLVYTFSVNNALASPNGDYTALVKVTSNRPVGAAAPGDPDDVNGVNASLDVSDLVQFTEIATYQVFDLEVSQVVGQPPVADLAASKTEIMQGNGIYFFPGPGTTDPDGTITNYYYDFDYDGSTFTNEATNTTGAPVSGRFNTVGTVTVAMRVRDNSNNLSPIDTLTITVVAPGDPFPPANPMNSFTAEA